MKKIVVIGCGMGGIQAAKVLAENGHDVTVYEAATYENVSHNQIDGCERKLFTDLDIPVPEGTKVSTPCYFVGPYTDSSILLNVNEEDRDWSIERRTFLKERIAVCKEVGVKFCFGSPVDKLIVEKDEIKGIIVGKEEILADLVIDASGVYSPFRASLKGKYGITENPKENEVFSVNHAYWEEAEGVEYDNKYRFYLKYQGMQGISWCGKGADDKISTLIGTVGTLTEEKFEEAFAQLRKDNPIISDNMIRGGYFTSIPVRYPCPIMVANGYALVGDSAFMTIPLLGNGVANSIRAGQMLAEEIVADDSVRVETLWKYEVRYFKQIGALCTFIDFIKRGLLATDNDDLRFLIESGAINDDDVACIFNGKTPKMSPEELAEKVKNLCKSRSIFKVMGKNALLGVKAMLIASKIPEDYDTAKIFAWKFKLDNCFKNV